MQYLSKVYFRGGHEPRLLVAQREYFGGGIMKCFSRCTFAGALALVIRTVPIPFGQFE
jgi:hypothetical protein